MLQATLGDNNGEGDTHDAVLGFTKPNQRKHKSSRRARARTNNAKGWPRQIESIDDGSKVQLATDLPYEATGLQWRGRRAVTVDGLRSQVEPSSGRVATESIPNP